MSKLRFSVVACMSEDAGFPASELDEHAANSQGYMTAKNCRYPQELVLQLQDGVCRLTQVQILSHQTHIATKMELFVSKSSSFEGDATRFSRLGFLTLKANTESRYMARELKTVHIDQEAALLKIRIHQCHVNEHNLYNQVGIMAINLCGESEMGLLPSHSTDEVVGARSKPNKQKSNGSNDLSFDMRFDAKTAARIREIQMAKDQAVANEDYDQAKRLKQMEEQLKSIGLQLARLEAQKREAVANEDYDLAKKVKQEIGMLEASVGSNETQPILPIPAVAPSPARSQVLPKIGAVQRSTSNFSPRDMYPEEQPQVGKNGSFYGDGNGSLRQSGQGRFPGDNDQDQENAVDYADQEVGDDGGPNPHFRGIPDAENLPDPDEIPPALAKESEELIAVIGAFFTRCFYSNLWNHRDAAIRKVTMEMDNYPVEPMRLLEVCSTLAQSGAGDRIAQVALSAFCLLNRMVSFGARIRRDDMCHILGNSMTQLVNKLGESQAKVRDEAAAVLERLASVKNVGVTFVTSHLTKRSKKPLGIKLLQGRLIVLKKLLEDFELVPDSDFSGPGIMSFLEDCNCLAHQSREIRDAAKEITVALYLVVGAEVEGFLKTLRPKQLEEYQAAFEAAETAKAQNRRGNAAKPVGGSGSGSVARRDEKPRAVQAQVEDDVEDAADSEDEESVDEYTCPFCGVVDEKFDSDYLDQHFWASCKMLTPCKMCGQVIEISTLNEHLLTECEMQQNHRECPRCGEAITAKFYERHVSLNDCPPRAPLNRANRCPLCHDDINPGKRGWRRHLLEEGCPSNPRS